MEIAAAVLVPAVESASPLIATQWRDHRDIKKNMEDLREVSEKLNHRKADMKKRLESEVESGETEEVEEVKFWLERVEKINEEVDEIGKKVARVKFFSRAGLGRKVVEMIPKVEKLYEEGTFAEGSTVRKLRQRGSEKPTVAKLGLLESTSEKTRDEILECLNNENFTRIGVYGMGGIGKTTVLEHVHNFLLKRGNEIGNKFDKVIWITASKDSIVTDLQDKILRELGFDIPNDYDEARKANMVYKELNKANNKRFVLIIDDLWEDYSLERVGIPNPTRENGCKLMLTTRSHDICSRMKCDPIVKMGLQSEQEALDLFLERVGKSSVASDPKLGQMARLVARECAGLPLTIVTVAESLRDKKDPIEWEVALTELKDASTSGSTKITANLRFSYDRLKDDKLKKCLLYCALYSKDYLIERDLLIDQLIAEGVVDQSKAKKYQVSKCHVMLKELVSHGLLIDTVNSEYEKCVKLHGSVRDMAIQIMRESPSMVEEGEDSEKWDELVEKVSLMGDRIDAIPFSKPPNCPRLSTLFFNGNERLETIFDDFFIRMQGLCVLNLSETKIERLPSSVSSLINLYVLLLRSCRSLVYIPDLSNLRKLTRLDLWGCYNLEELPRGVEKLAKLTHLELGRMLIESLPEGLIRKLSDLRYFSINYTEFKDLEIIKDLGYLKKLETLKFSFPTIRDFQAYVSSFPDGDTGLVNFLFEAGEVSYFNESTNSIGLSLRKFDSNFGDSQIMLPKNVEDLTMEFTKEKSLCRPISVKCLTTLKRIKIRECYDLECMFYSSPAVFSLLRKIEELDLFAANLHTFIGLEPLPLGAFSSLKKLNLLQCRKIKTLFSLLGNNASFPYLEAIEIKDCDLLETMIAFEDENAIVTLPSLKMLKLINLPKLNIIPFVADSLSTLVISDCPELKNVVFLERKLRLCSLQHIEIDADPWKSLAEEHMSL